MTPTGTRGLATRSPWRWCGSPLFLVREPQAKTALEDCLLAGHQDCDLFVPQPTVWPVG